MRMKPKGKQQPKAVFDPKVFLTKTNGGRKISDYGENKTIFSQSDPADAVFYIHKGKVRLSVVSQRGRKP